MIQRVVVPALEPADGRPKDTLEPPFDQRRPYQRKTSLLDFDRHKSSLLGEQALNAR